MGIVGLYLAISYQWLHDKLAESRKERERQSKQDWLSLLESLPSYENGAVIQVKKAQDKPGIIAANAPPVNIRGQTGVVQSAYGWSITSKEKRRIYEIKVGTETYLIDEIWLIYSQEK